MKILQAFVVLLSTVSFFSTIGMATVIAAPPPVTEGAEETYRALLSETFPFSFVQWSSPLNTEDFRVVVSLGEKSTLHIDSVVVPGSIQWIRVGDFVLPRMKVQLTLPPGVSGKIYGFGNEQKLGAGLNHFLVPAVSHREAALHFELEAGGKKESGDLWLEMKRGMEVVIDPSCNSAAIRFDPLPSLGFVSVGCKTILTSEENRTIPVIQADIVSSFSKPGSSFHRVQLSAVNPEASLGAVTLKANVPRKFLPFSLGIGVGPYTYRVHDGDQYSSTVVPLPTLYLSYTLRETMRLVSFGALAPHRNGNLDYGLYLWFEEFRGVDDRLSLNLLVGARGLFFRSNEIVHSRLNLPQGLELVGRDFLVKRYSLSIGAFIYPKTEDRAYTNIWIRYGKPGIFGEVNYISWQESLSSGKDFKTSSLGLSVGFPLYRN